MRINIQKMATLIEFAAGSGLAIFFHVVLHHVEAAYIIFGVGLLLSLATHLLREDIGQTRERLIEQYHQAHEITFAIARITDPECRDKAHEILAGAQRTLSLLMQGYVPLDETEFYMKATRYFDESKREVKTVDPLTTGWESRGALINYFQANIRAVERGVRVTRIFVIDREALTDAEVQRVIMLHLKDGIDVRIVHRDELPAASDISGRDTACSFDFAIYDDKVATEVFSLPGKYFGRKTREGGLVETYRRLFELIEHGSHCVSQEDDRVVLSADLLPVI